jgi:hypothetical protein
MTVSLKEKNRRLIWVIIAANALVLHTLIQENALRMEGLRALLSMAPSLLPVGLAGLAAVVLNGLLSADLKARMVWFWRRKDVLPGYRAFTYYAKRDPRVDVGNLKAAYGAALPTKPAEQNRGWYKLYKTVEDTPAVLQVHRDFLLLRDYTGLAVLFLAFLGGAGLFAIPSKKVAAFYLLGLVIQYVLARQAAATYGVRLVTTVLARVAPLKPE